MNKTIDKPWVAFGIFKSSMGKIIDEKESSVYIFYIETQVYHPQSWDSRDVKRFDTPQELAEHISGYTDEYTYDGAMQYLRDHFPGDFKEE